MPKLNPIALAATLVATAATVPALAQTPPADDKITTLPAVTVKASADASKQGLSPAYAGGQVARGGRAGILGTRDNQETPFSITSYTNEFIQDRQARSVGEVLQADPSVRTARGFGNFQEAYFIRGFILDSDSVAYNGLYSLLPRQYIATELFERVEVLRGASTFLAGANPSGSGIGGAINLLPKRAPNQPITQATIGYTSDSTFNIATDIARRFGPDNATGVRFNAALRDGETSVNSEKGKTGLLALGLDWRSRNVRLSGDIGWQDNRLKRTRTNVTLSGVTAVPAVPDPQTNWAQPWSYSNERDLFGTARGEWDLNDSLTAWAAYGIRRSKEDNSLANLTVTNATTGAGNTSRFDNTRKDKVDTGELGLRGKLTTGPVKHEAVVSASYFLLDKRAAYVWDFFNTQATNLYNPVYTSLPAYTSPFGGFSGGVLSDPRLTGKTRLTSYALGDSMSFAGDSVLLTLGARRQSLDVANYAYGTAALSDRYIKDRTSPMAAVVFKASKQLSIYGNYIEGLGQGDASPSAAPQAPAGTPQPTLTNPNVQLPPYVSKQKEIGAKFDGGTIGGGVALFSTDKPRQLYRSMSPGTVTFTSEGKDEHKGVEFNVFGQASSALRLLGGATWIDAKQKTTGSTATEGKRVIGVPKVQANAGAEWDIPGLSGLAVDGRVIYTGSRYADDANTLNVPAWTRFDIGARYQLDVQGKLITLRARIDNLTNKAYWSSVGGYPGNGYLVLGSPRSVSLSASVDY